MGRWAAGRGQPREVGANGVFWRQAVKSAPPPRAPQGKLRCPTRTLGSMALTQEAQQLGGLPKAPKCQRLLSPLGPSARNPSHITQALAGWACIHPQKRRQISPTLSSPLSPSSTLQRALWERGDQNAWGSLPEASGSGVPGACQQDVPVQNERPVAGRGGSLYLSYHCLMYTHPLYLLSNKRNTSVLPTETAHALTPPSPRARRRSRATQRPTLGTSAPS